VQWSRALGAMNHLSAGTDWRWVDGDSNEDPLDAVTGTQVTLMRISGGTQRTLGVFVQDIFVPVPQLTLTFSARADQWRNYDGHNLETTVATGLSTPNNRLLADRDDTVGSPRVAALYRFTDSVSAWGAWSKGFRAPTLNELYRQFRVGAILTLANDQLGPERLTGGEAGLNVAVSRNTTVRTTWFDNRVRNPVSNVTIALNTQQRLNLGRTRIWGVQSDVEYRLGARWRVSGGYLYNDATVKEFVANPALVGKFLAQVPKHRGSAQASYSHRLATVGVRAQFFGRQFDDDQNVRIVPGETDPGLPGYPIVDVTGSAPLGRNIELFVGAQNLFDKEYFVGTLPTTIGSPRLVNGGIRVRLSGR